MAILAIASNEIFVLKKSIQRSTSFRRGLLIASFADSTNELTLPGSQREPRRPLSVINLKLGILVMTGIHPQLSASLSE